MRLIPRGNTGWSSPDLRFGKAVTLVLGPNGAGKTPLMRALQLGLGYPVELTPLIISKSEAVEIEIAQTDGERWKIRRDFSDGVSATVTEAESGRSIGFSDEQDFSEWILPRLGLDARELLTLNSTRTPAYLSVIGPALFIDQDTGWGQLYTPLRSFIKNQREEVVRWLLRLPTKNAVIEKAQFEKAKREFERLTLQLDAKRGALKELAAELAQDAAPGALAELESREAAVAARLRDLASVLESIATSKTSLDDTVVDAVARRDAARFDVENAKRRCQAVGQARADVEAEVRALEQNEVAAEVFRTLCSSQNCRFFRQPEESYGRRLLFLKDQLKDFESAESSIQQEVSRLADTLKVAESEVARAIAQKRRSIGEGHGDVVDEVTALADDLSTVRMRLGRVAQLEQERERFEALLNQQVQAGERVDELKPARGQGGAGRLLDARVALAESFNEWLVTLQTPNVQADATFDEELRLILGGERFRPGA
ncbi:MAG: AAA family ATPase, partial [Polyangiaceae bacterium]